MIYASTATDDTQGSDLVKSAVECLLRTVEEKRSAKVLWSLQFQQRVERSLSTDLPRLKDTGNLISFPPPSSDLVFADDILQQVETAWRSIVGQEAADSRPFLKFEDREAGLDEDEN